MNIYVGNLNYRVREDDLKQVMEEYGTVESVKIIKDRETGKSKGFGFVEMPDDEAAKALFNLVCIVSFHYFQFHNAFCSINVFKRNVHSE